MRTLAAAAVLVVLVPQARAQEAAGSLTLTIDGEEHAFVLVQGAEGSNPGSRYSRLGDDVVLTIVGVQGEAPRDPAEADTTVELRFTVDATGPEVRSGSVISYSTTDAEGMPDTRGGTAEVTVGSLTADEDGVAAEGSFTADLPGVEDAAGAEMQGRFQTTLAPREEDRP